MLHSELSSCRVFSTHKKVSVFVRQFVRGTVCFYGNSTLNRAEDESPLWPRMASREEGGKVEEAAGGETPGILYILAWIDEYCKEREFHFFQLRE